MRTRQINEDATEFIDYSTGEIINLERLEVEIWRKRLPTRRIRQIKKAIHIMRIAYKKQWPHSLLISELLQDYWLKFEGGIKPDDTPF